MGVSNLTSSIRGTSGQEEIYNIRRVQASKLQGDTLKLTTATITNLRVINASLTNASIQKLRAVNASITNASVDKLKVRTSIVANSATFVNATVTNTISVGSIRVGHGADRFEVTTGLGPRLFGTTTLYDDMRIPLTNTRVGGAGKDPAFSKVINNIRAWVFSNGASQNLFFVTQVPHSWKQQGEIHPHIHWMPTTTATGFCRWDVEYVVSDINATMQVEPIRAVGTTAAIGVAWKHYLTDLGGPNTVGSNLTGVSGLIAGRIIYRGDVGDHGEDVAGLELDFHYEIDSMGSDEEYTKA